MTAAPALGDAVGLWLGRLRVRVDDWRDRAVPPIEEGLATCFVVGCGNSGTTLVAARLGLHPLVFTIPRETTMFRPRRRLGEARARLLGWMAKARADGATVLVEKTPKHVHMVDRIRRLLPAARVIVVMRNPFDTALSLSRRPGGDLEAGIDRWLLDNRAALALGEDAATTRLRYERLTAEPEREMRRLLGFLGLDWDPAVLAAGETAYGRRAQRMPTMRLRVRQVAEPIRANAGQWRRELSAAEIDRVRRRTGELWRALGGDPATGDWLSD